MSLHCAGASEFQWAPGLCPRGHSAGRAVARTPRPARLPQCGCHHDRGGTCQLVRAGSIKRPPPRGARAITKTRTTRRAKVACRCDPGIFGGPATERPSSWRAGPGSMDQLGRLPLGVFSIDKYSFHKKNLQVGDSGNPNGSDLPSRVTERGADGAADPALRRSPYKLTYSGASGTSRSPRSPIQVQCK